MSTTTRLAARAPALPALMFAAIALAGCASGPSPSADLLPPSARTKAPAPPSYTRQHQQMDDLARDGARLMQDAGRLRGGGD